LVMMTARANTTEPKQFINMNFRTRRKNICDGPTYWIISFLSTKISLLNQYFIISTRVCLKKKI
jgi:hypothetical protein